MILPTYKRNEYIINRRSWTVARVISVWNFGKRVNVVYQNKFGESIRATWLIQNTMPRTLG